MESTKINTTWTELRYATGDFIMFQDVLQYSFHFEMIGAAIRKFNTEKTTAGLTAAPPPRICLALVCCGMAFLKKRRITRWTTILGWPWQNCLMAIMLMGSNGFRADRLTFNNDLGAKRRAILVINVRSTSSVLQYACGEFKRKMTYFELTLTECSFVKVVYMHIGKELKKGLLYRVQMQGAVGGWSAAYFPKSSENGYDLA
uniref:Uncharacterized protein n=1 Tax=Romanomermis culicivorax TaxID=13658 RepID=A0A915I9L8_ROMCU